MATAFHPSQQRYTNAVGYAITSVGMEVSLRYLNTFTHQKLHSCTLSLELTILGYYSSLT